MSDPVEVTPELLKSLPLPQPDADTDKDERGRVLILAGSRKVPGAAVLCGLGAMRAGAGKLQLAATPDYAQPLAFALPEGMVVEAREAGGELSPLAAEELSGHVVKADAAVIGPGMLNQASAGALACALMAAAPDTAFVIDAAALTGLAERSAGGPPCRGRAILTPHLGEMASLMKVPIEQVQADPKGFARRAAEQFQAVVALKGGDTHIAAPDGRAWINRSGAQGLATSGSGDVLAGVIGGLAARGADPATAAVWGVFLHARAGAELSREVGRLGFLAREIPGRVPALLARFDPG